MADLTADHKSFPIDMVSDVDERRTILVDRLGARTWCLWNANEPKTLALPECNSSNPQLHRIMNLHRILL
jgi:hypothetical protein